jgi:hypothetical protein
MDKQRKVFTGPNARENATLFKQKLEKKNIKPHIQVDKRQGIYIVSYEKSSIPFGYGYEDTGNIKIDNPDYTEDTQDSLNMNEKYFVITIVVKNI